MKKKLKGLVALIMAIAMIVSIAPSSFGAISSEEYDNLREKYMKVVVEPDISIAEKSKNGGFNASDYYYLDYDIAYEGEKPLYEIWSEPDFHEIVGWTIWEIQSSGYVLSDSKSKTVPVDYIVTADDIKEFGLMDSIDSAYAPYVEAILEPKDFVVDIYNADGTIKTGEVSVNIDNYMTNTLSIPEGYTGYVLYTNSSDDLNDVHRAFVADCEDLWTEIVIMNGFGYEPGRLVPVKGIPYYMEIDGGIVGWEIKKAPIVYLEPGEKILENKDVKELLKHYTYDADNITWDIWQLNYCGSTASTNLNNAENNYEFTTDTALSVEQYTDTRKELATDYPDIYYYEANFLGLRGKSVNEDYPYDEGPFKIKEYSVPVYTLDDEYCGDAIITKDNLSDYDWEIDQYFPREIWTDVHSGECGWKFEYDGVDYGEVNYWQDIWDIAIEDGNYDKSKAKLVIVCDEHNYVKDSVVEAPTVDKKGKSKYVCSVCDTYKIVEDIDKLIAIDSIELKGSLFTYTGSNIIPGFDVKAYVNSQLVTLTQGEDYTVSYSNNKMPGIATVTVTGKGKFAGTKTAQFTIKPAKVTNLKATPGINQITLSWNAVAGVTGYMVFASAEEGDFEYIGSTTKTSFVAAGLPNGTEYDYKVAAYIKTANGNIKGTYSDTIRDGAKIELKSIKLSKNSFAYTGEYIKPAVTVTAYDVTGREVTLTNNTDYKVEYKNFKNPGIATVTITGKGNYYGTLTATFTIKPNWVKSVKQVAASTYTKSLRIKWESVVGVTGYEVYKSDAKNGTYKLAGTTASTEFTSKNLEVGTSYYYKVRAYKTVNGKKIYGNFSNVLKATTKTVTPSKVMTSVKSKKTNVKWYYSKGAAGYEVYMSTNPKYIGSKVAATTSAVRNVDLTNLEKGKTYYVRVRAYTKTASGQKMYTAFTDYVSFKAK